MTYHLVPLGCQMNQSDTERIRAVLESLGCSPASSEEHADILGVVACSVRQKAIDKVYGRISKWTEWKRSRPLLTFVSGCVLPTDREKFIDRFDLLFTINELPQLPEMLRDCGLVTPASLRAAEQQAGRAGAAESPRLDPSRSPTTPKLSDGWVPPVVAERRSRKALSAGLASQNASREAADVGAGTQLPIIPVESHDDDRRGFWKIAPDYTSNFEAYVPIQNGCDKFCTFCAVPYTRGREVSRPSDEILQEVESLVANGYRSITLLGQNVNSYGLDRQARKEGRELSFAELLKEIGEIGQRSGQRFWTYFTSPHPRDMTPDVIDVISEYSVLARQIHLPIQSGDDKVLIRMNRNHTVNQYRQVVRKIRDTIPEATLFTDIIVGFTGETHAQFEQTRAVMRDVAYNMAYIAMYSPRPGAASSRWEDDVPKTEKKSRLHTLSGELQETSLRYNQALIGAELPVLVEGADRKHGYLSGKTEGKLIVRFRSDDQSLIGSFAGVRVTSVTPMSMEGELLSSQSDRTSDSAHLDHAAHEYCRNAFRQMLEQTQERVAG